MPRSTDRACLLKDLENLIRMMMLFDDDKTEDFEDMMELYSVISGSRYIQQRTKFPKSIAFCNGIFEKFFSAMEYLLADAGYGLCEFICTPYRHPLAAVPRNQLFNVLYSSGRVIIEHVNGRIKSRFGSFNPCNHRRVLLW